MEALPLEVLVEGERRVDAVRAHDLEARPVDERDRSTARSEHRGGGGTVHRSVDPYHLERRFDVGHELSCPFDADPAQDEGSGLDEDVAVSQQRFSSHQAPECRHGLLVLPIVAIDEGVDRRGVYEDRHVVNASSR